MTRGAHTLKFGVEIRRDRYNQGGNLRAHGTFSFDGSATQVPGGSTATSGFGFADFLLGSVKEADRTANMGNAMFRSTSVYTYAQDDWKISRRLTLSVGVRYETMQPWHDKYCGFANATLPSYGVGPNGNGLLPNAPPPILVRPCDKGNFYDGVPFRYAAGVQTSVDSSLLGGKSLVRHDWLDFAPRIGFAWNPFGDTSIRVAAGRFYAQDIGNPVYDMARNLTGTDIFVTNPVSNFDQNRRFVTSAVYLLPVGKGQKFLNRGGVADAALGGWQLGSILTFMDGFPVTQAGSGDSDSLNQNSNACNATGISPFLAHPTPQMFWNINAFNCSDPKLYYNVGNIGMNTLRSPGTRQWDFSAVKYFRITERHNVQFRFESFNFSNHPNWNTPSSSSLTPQGFGIITSAKTMRQLQFALKYSF